EVGSSATLLPAYLLDNSIEIVDETKKLKINHEKLNFIVDDVEYTFDKDDVITTNDLKNLSSTTVNDNSKMVLFDPNSTMFNYANYPSYLKPNLLLFPTGSQLSDTFFSLKNISGASSNIYPTEITNINGTNRLSASINGVRITSSLSTYPGVS